ncbi:hypothetical protein HN011_006230, partial [Eciton burchellii]
ILERQQNLKHLSISSVFLNACIFEIIVRNKVLEVLKFEYIFVQRSLYIMLHFINLKVLTITHNRLVTNNFLINLIQI